MAGKKIAVVTGGMGGLGESISTKMADAGYRVVVTYSPSNTKYKSWLEELKSRGYSFAAFPVDVVDYDSCAKQCAAILSECGPIDILVNNAGITKDNLFMRMKDDEWDQVIAVNLTAAFRLSRAVLRGMMKKRWGRIIQITSIVAATGNPGQGNYAAAKAGLVGMTKSLAAEVASRHITVNAVAPGFIQTAMTEMLTDQQKELIGQRIPAGRMGMPQEIAAAVAYLASQEAAYVTGETIHINGGMAMI